MALNQQITIYINGLNTEPHIFNLADSTEELYTFIRSLVNWPPDQIRLFLKDGTEVFKADYIRQNDIIYVTQNEDFSNVHLINDELNEWITLNVGGECFTTTRRTLTVSEPLSMLARMFSKENRLHPGCKDSNGAYLIDRSPKYFEPLLNYLRCGQLVYDKHLNPEGILAEARFFGIESVIPLLEAALEGTESRDTAPLTRRDVVDSLITSASTENLRFQGVNLAGADLSKLDLRAINFKYANLQKCNLSNANLSYCCLERTDLSFAILDNAQLIAVQGLRANMEGASMRNCNFKDPLGPQRTNLEGVNLKGACLEDSDMGGVNLRIANCKNTNLKNCNLRAAILAGADLENCDLSGSDLHEANLRGANLKNAAFELMLTPLHMSQTIR